MRRFLAALLALAGLSIPFRAPGFVAQEAPGSREKAPSSTRGRWHFVFAEDPAFELSVLFARASSGDETRLLISAAAGRFELLSRQDPTDRHSTETVKDAASGALLSRHLLLSAYGGVAGCETVRPPDACILFETSGGKVATSLARFGEEGAPAVRGRVLTIVPEELKRRLLLLEPIFAVSTELGAYGLDFLGLVWPGRFPEAKTAARRGRRTRGCDFDATFGFPCDPDERRREEARFGKAR